MKRIFALHFNDQKQATTELPLGARMRVAAAQIEPPRGCVEMIIEGDDKPSLDRFVTKWDYDAKQARAKRRA